MIIRIVSLVVLLGLPGCSSKDKAAPAASAGEDAAAAAPTPGPIGATVAPPAPVKYDRTRLAATVEPCINHDGAFVKCITRVPTGNRPKALAFSPDSKELWVALHYDKPAVAVYDVDTFAMVGAVELGKYGAVELTFSSDGERVYFSQFETAAVYEIDRRKRKLLRKLETGSAESKIVALSPDDGTLYVANWKGNDITEIDLANGEVRRVLATAGIPRGLYPSRDGETLYVAGYSPPRLLTFDLASGKRTTVASFGGAIRHIAADEAGGRLYFSDLGKFKIWQLDLGTGEVSEFADTNPKPNTIDLTPDKRILFVSNRGANNPESYLDVGPEWGSVLAFDTATGELVDAIIAGNQSTGLDVSPDGRLLAVSDFLDNRINIYEIPPSATLVAGGGGNGASHRAVLAKKGAWGRKAARDRKVFAGVEVVAPSP